VSIPDKVAAAKKINEFLQAVVTHGGLRFKYRIVVDPPLPENRDWEKPEILVDFPARTPHCCSTVVENCCGRWNCSRWKCCDCLRRAREDSFDCQNQRSLRIQELRTAATVAAERCGRRGRRTSSVRCRRGSGGLFTWPCATRLICGPRVRVKDAAVLGGVPKDFKPAGKPAPRTLP